MAAMSVQAQQADIHKMSAYVRSAATEWQTSKLTPQTSNLKSQTSNLKSPPSTLTAFVRISGTDADALLNGYGCRKYAQLGDICIASIPLSQVATLASHPAVQRIEANACGRTLMDTTTTVINALEVYNNSRFHQAFTGQGVVMGVMDVGFDLTHPNFYDATATHYRIGAFWDQLSKDTVGSPFPVGRDFVGYDAVLSQERSIDGLTQGHGTHTLGCAAGSGYDTPYRGMAFESDICLVSNAVESDIRYIDEADYYKYTTATDALGFKYLFDYADQQGKPCVASFSEGYPPYLDEEDQLYTEFLEQLCGPGHIIVVSAGNENQRKTYMAKPAGMTTAGAFLDVSSASAQYIIRTDSPCQLQLLLYEGHAPTRSLTVTLPAEATEQSLTDTLFIGSDTLAVALTTYHSAIAILKSHISNLKSQISNLKSQISTLHHLLRIHSNRKLPQLPYIALTLSGIDSDAEVFGSSSSALTERSNDPRWVAADYGHNILAPGCFPSVICVGSTSHRAVFRNQDGQWHVSSNVTPGKRSYYSSTGPTMDGQLKPDVTAPGQNIISSYSHFINEGDITRTDFCIRNSTSPDGQSYPWSIQSGTSMSTPIVAGAIALWLQAKPDLTPAEVLDVFSHTCRKPDDAMSYPNHDYGYGEIDVYRGLLHVLGLTDIQHISGHQPAHVRIKPQHGAIHLCFDQPLTSAVQVSIYSTAGVLLSKSELTPDCHEATLPVTAEGIILVQTDGLDAGVQGSQLLRMP